MDTGDQKQDEANGNDERVEMITHPEASKPSTSKSDENSTSNQSQGEPSAATASTNSSANIEEKPSTRRNYRRRTGIESSDDDYDDEAEQEDQAADIEGESSESEDNLLDGIRVSDSDGAAHQNDDRR